MKDYSEFVIILDRSGSMQQAARDHEGGLNSFVQDQKRLDGDVRLTLIQFDSENPCEVVYDGATIDKVGDVRLIPRGGTPLLDAVGLGVAHVSKRIGAQTAKPDIVVVMVITDGEENSSREWTKARVKQLIADKEKEGWKFLYLGANVDAFAEASGVGFSASTTANFCNNAIGVRNTYAYVSSGAVCARMTVQAVKTCGGISLQDVANATSGFDFTQEQRLASMGQGSCTCIGTPNGDPNCVIHAKEVQMKGNLQWTSISSPSC